jgi:hypothetical protein
MGFAICLISVVQSELTSARHVGLKFLTAASDFNLLVT